MHIETVFDTDQADRNPLHIKGNERSDLTESEWVLLKKDLQSFLFRKENEDRPAFSDDVIFDWIAAYGEMFNEFFEHTKAEDPAILLEWIEEAGDDDKTNDADFLLAWASWRAGHQKLNA